LATGWASEAARAVQCGSEHYDTMRSFTLSVRAAACHNAIHVSLHSEIPYIFLAVKKIIESHIHPIPLPIRI